MALVEEIRNQLNLPALEPIDCLRGACVKEKAFRDQARNLEQYEFVESLFALGEKQKSSKVSPEIDP